MTGKTLLLILAFLLLLLALGVPVWLAVRVMRHPEKDRGMRRVMAEQRGTEYEKGMQKFFMVSYLSTGLSFPVAALLEDVFGMERFLSLLIPACALGLLLNVAKWRFTKEYSKAGLVTTAIGIVLTVTLLIVN
ncbi:MAG: hypothetical protein IJP44_15705 [Bacteroidales bacterium]|nr:hypothetical protein [Bacteroidales bacterium]